MELLSTLEGIDPALQIRLLPVSSPVLFVCFNKVDLALFACNRIRLLDRLNSETRGKTRSSRVLFNRLLNFNFHNPFLAVSEGTTSPGGVADRRVVHEDVGTVDDLIPGRSTVRSALDLELGSRRSPEAWVLGHGGRAGGIKNSFRVDWCLRIGEDLWEVSRHHRRVRSKVIKAHEGHIQVLITDSRRQSNQETSPNHKCGRN
mmetsp:Transcript_7657/g.17676  ORF Transcript_7657/g.17676 Transcript_7657/m.17676 type:complete len:203 (+) Transcript_7657:2326-2934(+)